MLRIQLLGSFHVIVDEKSIAKLQSERLQALLTYLVLHRAAPLLRQQLAVTFWPDTTDAQARTNLRTLIARLREALPDADRYFIADAQSVQWRSDAPCVIDVIEFEQALLTDRLIDAIAFYRGDLLPTCYDDWITGEREQLRQAYQHALDQLIAQCEQHRRFDRALAYAQRLLRHDPLYEATYRHLMRLQLASGDRSGALRTYHACAAMLRDELGVEPAVETRTLYAQLLRTDVPSLEAPLSEPIRTPFMGRQAEWAQLLATWRAAAAGHPQLMLITGEAGIGKTHLAEHLLAHLDRQSVTTISARSYATEQTTAYAPIGQWLRSEALTDRLPALDQVWLTEVSRLAPWLHTDRSDLPTPGPLIEAWQRQRLFEALARAVLIRREPLLLFLDDVQWCDRETLDWLHFLLQFDPAAPLLIVGTLLSEEAADNEALTTWRLLLQKHDRLTEIPLARFDAQTTAALASNLSGTELQATEATQLYRETEGNPLFVVELVRAGQPVDRVAGTTDQSGGTPLPPKVQATIQYRLSQLSANAQSLIQIAAVIGREFTVEVLARACDQTEDMLVAGLDELWRKHIVREQGASAYDFSHDKIRLVAYAALNATRRRMLHRKVAEALVNVYAIGLDAISGQIAQHYEIAGQTDRAVEFYRRAVDAARSIYSHHEALAALEKSINLLDSLVDEGVRRELAPHLQERLGDVREHLTQHGAARDAYAAALAGAPASDKIRQARLCRKIGKTLEGEQADYALVVEKYDRAEALLDTPHETAGADWWEEWCQVQLEHLILLYWWGRDEVMADWIAVARPLIEQHGTPAQLAALFSNLSRQLNRRNRFAPSDRALNYARAALGALFPSTSPELRAPYQFSLGFNLLWHGDLAEAQAELQAALTHAVQTGDVILQARCLAYLAVTCRRQNCAVETEAYARRGLAVAETARMLEYIGSNRANLAWVAWQRGDLMVAEQLAQAALEAWQLHTLSYPLYWFALLPLLSIALRRRALDRAIEWARRLIDPLQFKLPDPIEPLLQQGLAAAQAEDMATTQRLLTDAIDHAQSLGYL